MEQIRCPHCGVVFTIDKSGYAAIVSQIKDKDEEAGADLGGKKKQG